MQKRSISGSASAAGSAVDAMTALTTVAVQDLQAAMSALAGLLGGTSGAAGTLGRGNVGTDSSARDEPPPNASHRSRSGRPEDPAISAEAAFDEQTIREFDIPSARLHGELDRCGENLPVGSCRIDMLLKSRRERRSMSGNGRDWAGTWRAA